MTVKPKMTLGDLMCYFLERLLKARESRDKTELFDLHQLFIRLTEAGDELCLTRDGRIYSIYTDLMDAASDSLYDHDSDSRIPTIQEIKDATEISQ